MKPNTITSDPKHLCQLLGYHFIPIVSLHFLLKIITNLEQTMKKTIYSLLFISMACAMSHAQTVVSLSFGNSVGSNQNVNNATYAGPLATGSAGITGGVIDAGYWSDLSVRGGGTNYASGALLSNLTADDGNASTLDMSFTYNSSSGPNTTQVPATTASERIYRAYLQGNSAGTATFSINLSDMTSFLSANSATEYNVYIYSLVNNAAAAGVYSYSDGSTTFYQASTNSNTTPWVDGSFSQVTSTDVSGSTGNYVLFEGLTSDTLTITQANINGTGNPTLRFAGIQIVAVPEPNTVALAGIASACLLLRRKRRS